MKNKNVNTNANTDTNTEPKIDIIKLNNVRITYPHIFKPSVFNGQVGKYMVTAVFSSNDPHDAQNMQTVKVAVKKLLDEKNDGKMLPLEKICLRLPDNPTPDYDVILRVSSKDRPQAFSKAREKLEEDDGTFYSGCRVNLVMSLWFQKNNYGTRVNGNLIGLQFHANDKQIGGNFVNVEDMLEAEMDVEQANNPFATGAADISGGAKPGLF